jgi:surface antigen
MVCVSDETLMAYADGALTEDDCLRLEALLTMDSEMKARLAPFVVTRDVLGALFDQPMLEPAPAHLVDFVRRAQIRPSWRSALRETMDSMRSAFEPQGWLVPAGAAAAVLMVAGLAAGSFLQAVRNSDGGALIEIASNEQRAVGALQDALEGKPAASPESLENFATVATIAVRNTFASKDGRHCRQYTLSTDDHRQFDGFACRTDGGIWQIAIHDETGLLSSAPKDPSQSYRSAALPQNNKVEDAISAVIDGDVLDGLAEQKLIEQNWKSAPLPQ